jgi:hypothetical protein
LWPTCFRLGACPSDRMGRAQGACARSAMERGGVVAPRGRRRETLDQPRSRPVPSTAHDMNSLGRGLGWHGPIPVVGAPPSSECYASSRRHWVWGRDIRNAGRCISTTGS